MSNVNQFNAQNTGDRRARVVAKTAAYTVTPNDLGKCFTNAGAAGLVLFTLPTLSAKYDGATVSFVAHADEQISLQPPGGIDMRVSGDASAAIVNFTANHLGAEVIATWRDGGWDVAWTGTPTVAVA